MLGFLYNWLRKQHKVEWKIEPLYNLDNTIWCPHKVYPSDAGYDLYCCKQITIKPHTIGLVDLGFRCSLPEGYELQIRPKSGLALKNYITILNTPGTVDCNYRGAVQAIVMNHGDLPFTFKVGDKVCQGVICELPYTTKKIVRTLDDTARGSGGFGSTGK